MYSQSSRSVQLAQTIQTKGVMPSFPRKNVKNAGYIISCFQIYFDINKFTNFKYKYISDQIFKREQFFRQYLQTSDTQDEQVETGAQGENWTDWDRLTGDLLRQTTQQASDLIENGIFCTTAKNIRKLILTFLSLADATNPKSHCNQFILQHTFTWKSNP